MIEVASFSPFHRSLPTMHENRGMMAVEGTRMSPSTTLTPLQPVPQEMHTSVIRKTYDPSAVVPLSALEPSENIHTSCSDRMEEDDEFSDHDSHYSEDFIDDMEDIDDEDDAADTDKPPDMTKQLLDFAETANADIKKFFGRRKDEEDYCDIYENKWNVTKSGRELYYADLMKIVHGEDKGGSRKSSSTSPPLLDISNSNPKRDMAMKDNRNTFSGKHDAKIGLGPLEELFDYGLKHCLTDKRSKLKEQRRPRIDNKKIEQVLPMQSRKLPNSFWHEPGCQGSEFRRSGGTVIHSNNPPDFSDLLDSWRLDRPDFTGEVSSSDVSLSPE